MTAFVENRTAWRRVISIIALGGLAPGLSVAAGAAAAGQAHAGFVATWRIEKPVLELKTLNGKEPPLLPQARADYEKTRAARRAGDNRWDPVYQCNMHGVPRIQYENMPFQILQTPKQVLFMFQWNREFRMIDMGVEHTPPVGPTYMGQSVGHWDGDTLVVDTNGFDVGTFLDASGLPHGMSLHVVERYRVIDGGRTLLGHYTIEDPETFSSSWETEARFKRLRGVDITEDVCVERLNLPQYQ
ncbi:MAG: hypothetical protein QM718_12460 [Steroidobacteraceae bacterium]